MKFFLSLFVIVVMTPALGYAASFDCAKAVTPVEKAICGDSELSKLDEVMNAAYVSETTGLPPQILKDVKEAQRQWLRELGERCGQPPADTFNMKCLKGNFEEQTRILSKPIKMGDLVFYTKRRISSVKVPKNMLSEVGGDSIINQTSLQLIKAENKEADTFRNMLTAMFPLRPAEISGHTFSVDVSVTSVTPHAIQLYVYKGVSPYGAAQTRNFDEYYVYLRNEFRMLKSEEVFTKPSADWESEVSKLVEKYQPEGAFEPNYRIGAPDMKFERWEFREQGMVYHFRSYDVSRSRDAGVEAVIPWDEMKPYIKPNLRKLLDFEN